MENHQKINRLLNCLIGGFIGVFLGSSLYKYGDFKANPELYEAMSAPWYSGLLIQGVVVAIVVGIAIIVKIILKQRAKVK